jgi:hypothetical protein
MAAHQRAATCVIPAGAKRKAGTHERNLARPVFMASGLALRALRNDVTGVIANEAKLSSGPMVTPYEV